MKTHVSPDAVAGYIRLSRDDLRAPGSLEEKFAVRRQVVLTLARQHNLPLLEENILCERESGTKLATRPHALALLERARAGTLQWLITPAQDRLLRGDKHDEADIEDALCQGRVTLVTSQGITEFDENYDVQNALVFGINAAVARNYVAGLVKKRKETDRERLRQNLRTRGFAPYGYRYLRPTYDAQGRLLTPQTHEIVPEKYAIVCELFRRAPVESMGQIADDFNARSVPPPGHPGKPGTRWHVATLRKILGNPWYAGYYAQRHQVNRKGLRVRLSVDSYLLAEQEGDWEHPITLAQWQTLQDKIAGRTTAIRARTGLLTGLLTCAHGQPMWASSGDSYTCPCARDGRSHAGNVTMRARLDDWARHVVTQVIESLPDDRPTRPKAAPAVERNVLSRAYEAARCKHDALQEELTGLIRQSATLSKRIARADLDAALAAVTKERDAAKARLDALQAQLREPDEREARTLVQRVKAVGMATIWYGDDETPPAPLAVQQAVLKAVLAQLKLHPIPPGRKFVRGASVTLREWAHTPGWEPPPFPLSSKQATKLRQT